MTRRSYKGSSQPTTLTAPISNSDLAATVADGSTLPDGASFPFVLTIDLNVTGEEKILVASRSGNNLTFTTRGYDGTVATSHEAGASVRHTISAVDLDEANAHINATTGAHAATAISYAGSTNLSSTNVEAALDELDSEKSGTAHAHAASAVTYAGSTNLSATNVEAALDELDAEKSSTSHTHGAATTTFAGCMAYLAGANQTLTTAVETSILWDAETFDTNAFHDNSSNKERFTIPASMDGYYEITAVVRWSHNATGRRNVSIKKNGSTYLSEHNVSGDSGDSTGGLIQHISVVAYLVAGDYISITGTQASGGNLDIPAATAPSYAIIKRLGV